MNGCGKGDGGGYGEDPGTLMKMEASDNRRCCRYKLVHFVFRA